MNKKSIISGTVITCVVLTVAWVVCPGSPVASTTTGPAVTAKGRIVLINPERNSFTILGPEGTQEFHVAADTVMDLGGAQRIEFADLEHFFGAECTVQSVDTGDDQDATRVTLVLAPATASTPGPLGDRTRSVETGDGVPR
jgi:hypothetical protein